MYIDGTVFETGPNQDRWPGAYPLPTHNLKIWRTEANISFIDKLFTRRLV